ncbi:MAG TPA: GTP-binding protein [Chloroflexota bacterium]|nr:GTP-binding protein [Chloroflexota bacterium]
MALALDFPQHSALSTQHSQDLLRFSTAGSVDDGKSTLIGRLLYETKQIFDDQLEAVERASKQQGADYLNLALLTDGLRAERQQGITIDVAYRYFATPRRKFIIADTPGHVQYTRNMVTGASTSDLALILVDARNGVVEQTRRHALLSALLGVPRMVVCVNKMDLAGYSRETFESIRSEFEAFAAGLDVVDVTYIPISALKGDNVVERSSNMEWYDGEPLLTYLEHVPSADYRRLDALRYPVQWVIRPLTDAHHDYRGYAGQIEAGSVRPGDEVLVLPAGLTTRVDSVDTFEGPLAEASAPQSVTLLLADHLDISRGDMICSPDRPPRSTNSVEATLCWLGSDPLRLDAPYLIQHTTRRVRGVVSSLDHKLDPNTLDRDESASTLRLNDIGRVSLRIAQPLFLDHYHDCRATGSFILIDPATNNTVAGGLVL